MAESLPITSAAVHQKAESQPPERQRAQERRSFWWGHRAYWWCQLVVWTGNMGVSIWGGMLAPAKHVDGALHPVLLAFFFSTLTTVLTHVYRWVILSGHWKECGFPRLIPRVVVACLGCGMILAGLSWKVDHRSWEAENMGWGMAALLTVWLSVHFLAWSAAYFSWHYYGQLQEARLQKLRLDMSVKEAALASLRSQVNPHFLFNGLNTLRSLIDTDPARARMMVTHLAKIFRASLASGSTQLVPVQQELETVDAYLLIEKMRFEEKL
ncbi:MAG: sensor histidine kinase, partial [Verrucomicrobium sp.]